MSEGGAYGLAGRGRRRVPSRIRTQVAISSEIRSPTPPSPPHGIHQSQRKFATKSSNTEPSAKAHQSPPRSSTGRGNKASRPNPIRIQTKQVKAGQSQRVLSYGAAADEGQNGELELPVSDNRYPGSCLDSAKTIPVKRSQNIRKPRTYRRSTSAAGKSSRESVCCSIASTTSFSSLGPSCSKVTSVKAKKPIKVSKADSKNQNPSTQLTNLPLARAKQSHSEEIAVRQFQEGFAIAKVTAVAPDVPIPQLPPLQDLLTSSNAALIQRLIHAYGLIESLHFDKHNVYGTRNNTPNPSSSRLHFDQQPQCILNPEHELVRESGYYTCKTRLPAPEGQELCIETYYSLNQNNSSKSSTDLESQKKKNAKKGDGNDTELAGTSSSSESSLDECPGSPMGQYYEKIFIKDDDHKMILYMNPKVMFNQGLTASDGSHVPYPATHHPTHFQMSQVFAPCFQRSSTDLELAEMFKINPPKVNAVKERKLPRAKRGSSVPALDSYYGTADLAKVGHASYFIPMLSRSQRNVIGWRSEYRFGRWKYSLQKIPSEPNTPHRRVPSSSHVGPEITVSPLVPHRTYRGDSFVSKIETDEDNVSFSCNTKGPFGCLRCIIPCVFNNDDSDDEPDLLEDWMIDDNYRKKQEKRRRKKGKKSSSMNANLGGDVPDPTCKEICEPRTLPPPILIPLLGDINTWFFNRPPPPDYTPEMFAHTLNHDFGKPPEATPVNVNVRTFRFIPNFRGSN